MALPGSFAISYLLLAVVFGSMVFHARVNTGSGAPILRVLRWGVLRSFGKFSYSIYVFHLFAYGKAKQLFLPVMQELPPTVAGPLTLFSGILVSYLVGLFTWHALEKHFLKMKDRFAWGPDAKTGAAA